MNEYDTVLRIDEVAPDGRLSGTITTQAGWGADKAQPMTGWYFRHGDGGIIAFSAKWNGCDSVTSWIGRINKATGGFQAQWSLAGAAAPAGIGVVVGSNLFAPPESVKKPDKQKPRQKKRRRRRR